MKAGNCRITHAVRGRPTGVIKKHHHENHNNNNNYGDNHQYAHYKPIHPFSFQPLAWACACRFSLHQNLRKIKARPQRLHQMQRLQGRSWPLLCGASTAEADSGAAGLLPSHTEPFSSFDFAGLQKRSRWLLVTGLRVGRPGANAARYRQTARASGRPGLICAGTPARRCGAIRRCQLTASGTRVRAAQAGMLPPRGSSGK